jgi:hypothetical protein
MRLVRFHWIVMLHKQDISRSRLLGLSVIESHRVFLFSKRSSSVRLRLLPSPAFTEYHTLAIIQNIILLVQVDFRDLWHPLIQVEHEVILCEASPPPVPEEV